VKQQRCHFPTKNNLLSVCAAAAAAAAAAETMSFWVLL